MEPTQSSKGKLGNILERPNLILTVFGVLLLIGMAVPAVTQERMPEIPVDKMSVAQKKAAEEFLAGRGKPVTGPFIPLLRSPEVLVRAKAMGDYLRFKSALAPKLREFATLITAREWTQQFEWYHHSEFATEAGLNPAIIKAVAEGRRPEGMSDSEEIIYNFCTELQRNHSVSDTTYNKAIAAFGEQGTIDLVSLTGYYTFVSMILNVNRTGPPKGVAPLLAAFP